MVYYTASLIVSGYTYPPGFFVSVKFKKERYSGIIISTDSL